MYVPSKPLESFISVYARCARKIDILVTEFDKVRAFICKNIGKPIIFNIKLKAIKSKNFWRKSYFIHSEF